MEDLMVSAVLKPLLETLASIATDKFAIACGVQSELARMASKISAVRALLKDAEDKQGKNSSVKNWLAKLKDVVFVADDVIDKFATEAVIWKIRSERGGRLRAGKYFLLLKRFAFHLNIGEKIREVNRRFAEIENEKNSLGLIPRLAEIEKEEDSFELIPGEEVAVPESRMTTSAAVTSKVYGQEDDKKKVIDLLLKNLNKDLLVYVIYGMGGLGKTTLAKTIFHDFKVSDLFKLKIWVCVSDNFDIPRLIRAILESIDGSQYSLQETESLQLELKKKLSGKKFLLILDDVWNEKEMKWEEFRNILSCGAKGSAVIVTTRMKNLAQLMAPNYTHRHCLSSLSDDDSWSLFEQRAIGGRQREEYMERFRRDVLIKCCGLPLAINALGGLMRTMNDEDGWRSVMESEIWEEGKDTVLSALGVSFYHLSPQLRQCFTYCCVFPKDFKLDRDVLIQLWMANGFISSESRTKWYDLGLRIFNELVSRGFIQDVEVDNWGGITRCKIHDLMHDLALSIMGDECLLINAENEIGLQLSMKLRHISREIISSSVTQKIMSTKFNSLRSFLDCPTWRQKTVDSKFLFGLKHLRVLKVRIADDRSLVQISRLTHLRYLNLSVSKIKALPDSIIFLQNLQSLNLFFCMELLKLPRNLKYIKSLRFLDIRECRSLENMPDLEQLKSQQVRVNGLLMKLDNKDCQISDLKYINVFGELVLKQLESVRNPRDAREADLKSKSGLRSLSLEYSKTVELDENGVVDRVIDELQVQLHPNLKTLSIRSFPGPKLPVWLGALSNLVNLVLGGSRFCTFLPPLGKLPFLKVLEIQSMPLVEYLVGTENRSYNNNNHRADLFPALERLYLFKMPRLVAWTKNNGNDIFPTEIVMFKSLERLSVTCCENLVSPLPVAIAKGSEGGAMTGSSGTSSSLQSLEVDNYRQLVSLSKGLTTLKGLILFGFLDKDTPWEGLQHLSSVSALSINNCKRLTSLPDFLTTFNSLSGLSIYDCPNLTSLSENSRCIGALSSLEITKCEKLSALPDCPDTLEKFKTSDCPNLTSLPYGLLNNNTSLKKFKVTGCPELQKRCRSKGTDGYWSHIANIPYIKIGDAVVQDLRT